MTNDDRTRALDDDASRRVALRRAVGDARELVLPTNDHFQPATMRDGVLWLHRCGTITTSPSANLPPSVCWGALTIRPAQCTEHGWLLMYARHDRGGVDAAWLT
jgi:hypothetical protein